MKRLFNIVGNFMDRIRPRSLKQRWMRGNLFAIIVIVLFIVGAFSLAIASYYYSSMQSGLEIKAKTATDFFSNYITKTYTEYYDSAYKYIKTIGSTENIEIQFIGTDGRIEISSYATTSGAAPGTNDIRTALDTAKISSWMGRSASTNEHLMAVSVPLKYTNDKIIGVMRFVTSLKLVDHQILLSILTAAAIGLAILLFVFFTNLLFIRSVVEPVKEITAAARQIADGSYGIQVNRKKYRDELGEMVDAINDMSLKISQSERSQSEFLSSISHELRTPLTAINGWAETIAYDETLSPDSKRGMAIIVKETRRLTKMVEEILDFTRMENGRFTLNASPIDVAAELEDSIFAYREILHQDAMTIRYDPYPGDLPEINGDAERLRQVFFNIFDNAAKYAGDGKEIVVNTGTDGANIIIGIRDFGPGIPEDELERVKMKFYKGSSKMRGSGIGLAVCDEIIKYHGGTLTLSNAEGGGTLVTILLPIEPTFND